MQNQADTSPRSESNRRDLFFQLYNMMQLIRRTQEKIAEEYHPADEMRCPVHFCIGQEATPAALSLLLRPQDVVMSHHRSHGYYLAKGAPLKALIAELYGKKTGSNGGLAGSQELSCHKSGFYSGTILSGMFAMATGSAFSQQYENTSNLTVGVIGDGGMEEGIVFEALNLAAVMKLPVLFLCENNLYSAHTPIEVRSLSESLVERAAAFRVKTKLLDGNDPILLHQKLTDITDEIRNGGGPYFVEVQTYRTCSHVGPENDDVLGYRTVEELEKWRRRDPISALRPQLIASGMTESEIDAANKDIDNRITEAIEQAKKDPFPTFDDALDLNWSGKYAKQVTGFVDRTTSFKGGQSETQLTPY